MRQPAYLIVYVDTRALRVVGATIHSEPAANPSQPDGQVALDVFSCEGSSFEEAHRSMRRLLASELSLRWVLPLLPERG